MNDDEKDFEKQLKSRDIVFAEYSDKDLVFSEFMETERKPDIMKFMDDNLREGTTKNKLIDDYIELIHKEELPEKYTSHTLQDTPTIKILREIHEIYLRFTEVHSDKINRPELTGERIIKQLEKLDNSTAQKVALGLIEPDDSGFNIVDIMRFKHGDEDLIEAWKDARWEFARCLTDWIDGNEDDKIELKGGGELYFQFNLSKELGIIETLENKFLEVNGRPIDGNEIGDMLSGIFLHGDPKQWSKCYSQYGTLSSNDPIKSDRQKKMIKAFLIENHLKK